MSDERARKRVVVHGRVQGVGFRVSAQEAAWRLDLHGWVRNLRDGRRLEVVVEGDPRSVETFVAWLADGPPHAQVERLEVEDDRGADPLKPFAVLPTA